MADRKMGGGRGFRVWIGRGWPWAACLLSGLLCGLAYPPFSFDWLIWVALAPLIAALWFGAGGGRHGLPRAFLYGWLAGGTGFLIHLHWITEVTVAGWVALSLYCGLFTGVFAMFAGLAIRPRERAGNKRSVWVSSTRNLACALLGAAAWTGLEWLRGTLFTGFGWNGLGVALWENAPMIQIADITGVGGISFVICAVNLMVVLTVKRLAVELQTGTLRPHYDFAATIALAALVFAYGIRQILAPVPDSVPLRIAAVQANIPQDEKWHPEFERAILEKYRLHSEAAVALNPDLLLWPEAATPRAALGDPASRETVMQVASSWDGDFLLGTVHFDPTGDFNSILLLNGSEPEPQLHHKIHLVPFGEFIPFRNSFPVFVWIMGHLVPSDFDAGTEFTILETAGQPVPIGPLVCFEDTLGELARQFSLRGARLFVTVTNDGWFRQSSGSMQHLAQSVFRCAENKIPMVRVANTGVTCIVDRFGVVREILADEHGCTFIDGVLFGEVRVPRTAPATFYRLRGELFSQLCLAVAAAAVLRCRFGRGSHTKS